MYIKKRLDTHKLVEEFMLLANKEVAKFVELVEFQKPEFFQNQFQQRLLHLFPVKTKSLRLQVAFYALWHVQQNIPQDSIE